MSKEQLLVQAKELGIKDAGTLNVEQLKAAIKAAKTRNELVEKAKSFGVEFTEETTNEALALLVSSAEEWQNLVVKAEALGIESIEGLSNTELSHLILATENSILEDVKEKLIERLNSLASVLGIENAWELTPEELTVKASEKLAALQGAEKTEEAVEVKGRTDKTYKSKSGKEYRFKEKAPAAFRFLGKLQTQEAWIADEEAMELMVLGNLSYVEQIKK